MTESAQAPAALTSVPPPPADTGVYPAADAGTDTRTDSGTDAGAQTHPSVRELLTELAALEDATRTLQASVGTPTDASTPERLAALAREQEIIEELHRRCPDAPAS